MWRNAISSKLSWGLHFGLRVGISGEGLLIVHLFMFGTGGLTFDRSEGLKRLG